MSEVWTVTGPVSPDELGITLPHEHLFIDLTCYWEASANRSSNGDTVAIQRLHALRSDPFMIRDNCLLDDVEVAIEEVAAFRNLGGSTIIDVTLDDIGRDPLALREVADATGLRIVAGCGHYVHLAHPPEVADSTVESLAENMIRDLVDGIGDTGIRAGIIGELGTSDSIHPSEEKVLKAAAAAQQVAGVPITVHLHPGAGTGHQVLDILETAGADLFHVVLGHLDNDLVPFDAQIAYHLSLADRGAFIQYDCCGNSSYYPASEYAESYWLPTDRERAAAIRAISDAGYGGRLLLSQDVCKKTQLVRFGGDGYGHVLRSFIRILDEAGVGAEDARRLLVDNPRALFGPT